METISIPLNTFPGLENLSSDIQILGLKTDHPFIPQKDESYKFKVEDVRILLGAIVCKDNAPGVLFVGPKGTGKSSGIRQFHAYARRPLFSVSGNSSLMYDDMLGTKEIIDGDTQTLDGPLPMACQTPLATFLFEEIDRAPADVSVAMNPLLDGYDLVHTLDGGRAVKPTKGFRFMATANTYGNGDMTGEYTAANVMDTSLLDRLWAHEVWYPEPEHEFAILREVVPDEIHDDQIHQSIAFANDVRYLYTGKDGNVSTVGQSANVNGSIETTFSPRTLILFWKALVTFGNVSNPIEHALKLVVGNKCSNESSEAILKLAEAQFASASQ